MYSKLGNLASFGNGVNLKSVQKFRGVPKLFGNGSRYNKTSKGRIVAIDETR